jgi:leader peptidase (prepilin peptidase)/N-methyltransferase
MGLYLGSAVVPALVIGVFSGAVVGLTLMAVRGSGTRKLAVPFGPFLALGGVVALLAGQQIIDWYLGTFV